jgi:4'-phosphopantetheinyl transferase
VTTIEAGWPSGPDRPSAANAEIHIWRIQLDGTMDDVIPDLTPGERERAASFLRPQDALQFALSRAAVRRILARYLGQDPAAVRFERSKGGKPTVVAGRRPRLEYNMTHSHRLALCAVGTAELGIDVEWIRPAPIAAGIAAGIVSADGPIRPDEIESQERDWLFFQTWTRTEAALKATGEGLSAIDRRSPAWIRTLSRPGAHAGDGRDLRVFDLPVGLDYAAALAVLGQAEIDVIRCWKWTGSGALATAIGSARV